MTMKFFPEKPEIKSKYFIFIGWKVDFTISNAIKVSNSLNIELLKDHNIDAYDYFGYLENEEEEFSWIYTYESDKDSSGEDKEILIGCESTVNFLTKNYSDDKKSIRKMFVNRKLSELFGYSNMKVLIGEILEEDLG